MSRDVFRSRDTFLSVPVSLCQCLSFGLGPSKSRKMVMSRSGHEKILDLKQHSGL